MTENNVIMALREVQIKLKAPKSQFNKFGNYHYRNCEDILAGLKEVLPENCAVTVTDDIKVIGDRFYVVATAKFHCGDQEISVNAYAREPLTKKGMDEAQITGSTSSYCRKYALNGLFAIDDSKDSDDEQHVEVKSQASSSSNNLINKNQEFELSKLMFETKSNSVEFNKHYGVKSFSQLSQAQFVDAISKLKEKASKMPTAQDYVNV